ncbi:RecT family recombinase [Vibrio breoganii]|uniref:Phage recombination protein Bet n=1 Tax=Vibrio breoganii TaxID=553239 RepID=A0AAP8MXA2_9VIBR|nr:RecT family recombinase [Vibrio breoganii]PMP10251.1 hypothetical protein BCS93_11285 [Vibrio breoganii]
MTNQSTALAQMAGRLAVKEDELQNIILNTVMPNRQGKPPITQEQFLSFLAVANEYKLNPLTKEVYAFPAKGGGIQPIVSIDGWLKIINNHPHFDGMEFEDKTDANGKLLSVTCSIYRKDRQRATQMTEYMSECVQGTDTWKKWPSRMLRHKATIQCARYAFGLSGIIDPDEAERFEDAGVIETCKQEQGKPFYPADRFEKSLPKWKLAVESNKQSTHSIIAKVEAQFSLTDEQKNIINELNAIEGEIT